MIIKPCPHCGGTACLNSSYINKARRFFVYVKCDICSAQGKPYTCEEDPAVQEWNNIACMDAISAWNMRTNADKAQNRP